MRIRGIGYGISKYRAEILRGFDRCCVSGCFKSRLLVLILSPQTY
jgi:hypothetical protein